MPARTESLREAAWEGRRCASLHCSVLGLPVNVDCVRRVYVCMLATTVPMFACTQRVQTPECLPTLVTSSFGLKIRAAADYCFDAVDRAEPQGRVLVRYGL